MRQSALLVARSHRRIQRRRRQECCPNCTSRGFGDHEVIRLQVFLPLQRRPVVLRLVMGYDITRFQGDVDEELICPICSGVLEEPLQVTLMTFNRRQKYMRVNQKDGPGV